MIRIGRCRKKSDCTLNVYIKEIKWRAYNFVVCVPTINLLLTKIEDQNYEGIFKIFCLLVFFRLLLFYQSKERWQVPYCTYFEDNISNISNYTFKTIRLKFLNIFLYFYSVVYKNWHRGFLIALYETVGSWQHSVWLIWIVTPLYNYVGNKYRNKSR